MEDQQPTTTTSAASSVTGGNSTPMQDPLPPESSSSSSTLSSHIAIGHAAAGAQPVTTTHDAATPADPPDSTSETPAANNTQAAKAQQRIANQKLEKFLKLKSRTQKNPWDMDGWTSWLAEAHLKSDPELVRDVYDKMLEQFPTASKYWIAYAEFEQKQRAYDRVEAIFGRCLRNVPSLDLWKFYLTYVRRMHSAANMPAERKAEARATILKAFEFVLQNVGSDKEAGALWAEYIHFVKAGETHSVYEEQQQMDLLRRAYNRAIWIPLTNIEQIWKDYDAFENGLNKLTAKKFLSEKSAGYMTARTAIRELKTLLDPIEKAQKTWVAKPPTWTDKEVAMLASWKRYIAWEKTNPLRLDDKSIWINRVIYAYKSALLMLRYYPELYYDASSFLIEVGRPDDAAAMLKSGVETLPTSLLLNLSLAEREEARKRDFTTSISPIYDSLITKLESGLADVNSKYDAEREKLMASLQKGDETSGQEDWDGERREREREKLKGRQREVELKVEEKRKRELGMGREAATLVWIVYMRAARRVQGIMAARLIFTRARKSEKCTYHLWVAAALMEYFCNKDAGVAGRVFENALKTFNPAEDPQAPALILLYLDFLINLNDDNNTRALFERALAGLPPDCARPIWAKLLAYETEYGDLANVLKAEKRRAEAYPGDSANPLVALTQLTERWTFLDINQIGEWELGLSAQYGLEKKVPGAVAAPPPPMTARAAASHRKDDDRNSSSRKYQSLDSVHPERYPRPDMTKWVAFQPEAVPAAVRPPGGGVPDAAGAAGADQGQAPRGPVVNVPNQPVGGSVGSGGSGSGGGMMVPDAVVRLMAVLPPSETYNGPVLPINDIIDLFRQIPLPAPAGPPMMVQLPAPGPPPPPGPVAASARNSPYSDRPGNSPSYGRPGAYGGPVQRGGGRDGGRGGRGRGRGGASGSAARAGTKRRAGFDEDQPQYDAPSHVNRPPEHDIFRTRHQFKRPREAGAGDGPDQS
ncbi:mRNA 3'-end-processing protein rna14 [Geranomyces variabilis]|nr:mRNA 3'-end-processing protein rna14 [Geranomyces variabilis]